MSLFKKPLGTKALRAFPLAALALMLSEVQAGAEDLSLREATLSAPAEYAPASAGKIFAAKPELEELELKELRGGTSIIENKQLGFSAGNVAENVTSGNNEITAGSFSNLTGLPTVVQNTGSNVNIQTMLNVQVDLSGK